MYYRGISHLFIVNGNIRMSDTKLGIFSRKPDIYYLAGQELRYVLPINYTFIKLRRWGKKLNGSRSSVVIMISLY
jgi:hypothetical protein